MRFKKRVYAKYQVLAQHKILVIDDDKDVCQMIKDHLEFHDIEMDCCSSLTGALHKLQMYEYKYIVVDGFIGHENGLEIAKKIKEKYPDSKLVFYSGSDTSIDSYSIFEKVFRKTDVEGLISFLNR